MAGRNFLGRGSVRPRRLVVRGHSAVYHVMSRVVRRRFWLGDAEREKFREMLGKQVAFAGVEVLTYCLMGNHFHLLVRVPECPLREDGKHLIDDVELLRRYRAFYGDREPRSTYSVAELERLLASANADEAEEARCRVLARMGDLSVFVKELKQRFGIWFNDKHDNVGTIWCDRFKSVLVEDEAEVLTVVGAYIDLNPVRARVVSDPKEYRWCGFAEAMAGGRLGRDGVVGLFPGSVGDCARLVANYRRILYGKGAGKKRGVADGKDGGCIEEETVRQVLEAGGKVSLREALACQWRYFSEGKVLGRDEFSSECLARHGPPKGARRLLWKGFDAFEAMLRR